MRKLRATMCSHSKPVIWKITFVLSALYPSRFETEIAVWLRKINWLPNIQSRFLFVFRLSNFQSRMYGNVWCFNNFADFRKLLWNCCFFFQRVFDVVHYCKLLILRQKKSSDVFIYRTLSRFSRILITQPVLTQLRTWCEQQQSSMAGRLTSKQPRDCAKSIRLLGLPLLYAA